MTYDEYVGRAALEKIGKKKWNKRVERIIGVLRTVVNFDHLYIGGGNSKAVKFELPADVSLVSNMDGLTGGIALWRTEGPARRSSNHRRRAKSASRPRWCAITPSISSAPWASRRAAAAPSAGPWKT